MAINTYKKSASYALSKNFNSDEFDCHGKGCCTGTKIDEKLVEYLQKIREHFGKPITINSGYRCTTHNKNVGGATGSRHTTGQAADIAVQGVAPAEVAKYAESIGIKGIGLYETAADGYFVHIDTRTTKSFWYGQKQEYRSTFGGATTITVKIELNKLEKGHTGNQVKAVQQLLISKGFDCGPSGADGDFGANTEKAVKKFQQANSAKTGPADGIVGKNTWGALLGI